MVLAQYLFSDSQSFLIPLQSILVVSVFVRTTPQKHIQVSTTLRKAGIVRGVEYGQDMGLQGTVATA